MYSSIPRFTYELIGRWLHLWRRWPRLKVASCEVTHQLTRIVTTRRQLVVGMQPKYDITCVRDRVTTQLSPDHIVVVS